MSHNDIPTATPYCSVAEPQVIAPFSSVVGTSCLVDPELSHEDHSFFNLITVRRVRQLRLPYPCYRVLVRLICGTAHTIMSTRVLILFPKHRLLIFLSRMSSSLLRWSWLVRNQLWLSMEHHKRVSIIENLCCAVLEIAGEARVRNRNTPWLDLKQGFPWLWAHFILVFDTALMWSCHYLGIHAAVYLSDIVPVKSANSRLW